MSDLEVGDLIVRRSTTNNIDIIIRLIIDNNIYIYGCKKFAFFPCIFISIDNLFSVNNLDVVGWGTTIQKVKK